MGSTGQSLLCSTITVALFNLGAEHEHLNCLQQALFAYQKAKNFANKGGFDELETQAQEAIDKVQTRLCDIDKTLVKRSQMREKKSVKR